MDGAATKSLAWLFRFRRGGQRAEGGGGRDLTGPCPSSVSDPNNVP